MSDALKYVNLTVEGWGLLFCLLSAAILLIATRIDRATRRYFLVTRATHSIGGGFSTDIEIRRCLDGY